MSRGRARSSSTLGVLALGLGLAIFSCSPAASEASTAPTEATAPASEAGGPVQLSMPSWDNEGKEIELAVLHEDEQLKVAAIALRRGTALPTHEVGARITIQVVQGAGSLRVGEREHAVAPGSILVIDPKAPHAMAPDGDELVVLLVHYLK